MANTIIHPKPAHLAGDSAKFHSKLVGGKAKKVKKSMKKAMKGKKGKKPMRKTMKKKKGGDYNPIKGFQKLIGSKTYHKQHCEKIANSKIKKECIDVETLYRNKCAKKIRDKKYGESAMYYITGYKPAMTRAQKITEEGSHCVDLEDSVRKQLQAEAIEQNTDCKNKYNNEAENCKKQVN